MTKNSTILVTGATGKIGGQVVVQLLGTGAVVRALTRKPDATALPDGVEVVGGDLSDADTLDTALEGVDAVFLVFPTLQADDAAPAVIAKITEHVGRIVYLSAAGVAENPNENAGGIIGSHARVERLIEQSGMEWTFLRPSGFAANTLMWADQIRAGNVLRWFYGAATRTLIHEHDIGAVAVRTLTEEGHGGKWYHLTGPSQLTQGEQAHAIGEAIGRPVRFEELAPEIARQELFGGMPATLVDSILKGQAEMVRHPEPVTSTVKDLTGARARTFQQWAADHASDFR
ncbi:MAG: nucleoside-diphosphate sugar epimerase [Pseudonocardiales bacterium]|nr:NAD(P)H-binding protein [Actinomycetota bacterium]PZS17545.1 MAG: nucleoside-diphosphate sugar epimerase [Pseudonocardiales bacterium]